MATVASRAVKPGRVMNLRSVAWLFVPVVGLLLLQTYLVFREPIFTPVDELQHTDYVRTIAEDGHLPIYGEARIDPTLLAVYMHEYPAPFSPGVYRLPGYVFIDYEALQFPVYYVVAAPLYRVFDRDPRVAVYALRIENVVFSTALLILLVLLLHFVLLLPRDAAALAPLVFLAMPGVSLRHSQVTNQVLAALLLAVLFLTLVQQGGSKPGRRAFAEGALFGIAVLTKLTVIGAGAGVLAAWTTRPGGLRPRLLQGTIGFVIAVLPWLVWSLGTYASPLPWTTRHITLSFCPCPSPVGFAEWKAFVHDAWVNFVLPFEWAGTGMTCNPNCVEVTPRTAMMRVALVLFAVFLAAAVALALWTLRNRRSELWRPTLIAMVSIAGALVGIVGLEVVAARFSSTDLRELYVFAAPIVLVLGGSIARFDRRWVVPAVVLILALWLVSDYQMYSSTGCRGCPPGLFGHV